MPTIVQSPVCDETALVKNAQGGDLAAFGTLVERHLPNVRAFIAQRSPAPHLVDELSQETFFLAHNRLCQFTAGTSLRAWLQAIAWQMLRKEILRFSREQANRKRYADHWASMANQGWKGEDDRLDYLRECLRSLPDKQRELLNRKYREGEGSKEIAAVFNQSVEWVRTNLYRVRNRLRDCVERRRSS